MLNLWLGSIGFSALSKVGTEQGIIKILSRLNWDLAKVAIERCAIVGGEKEPPSRPVLLKQKPHLANDNGISVHSSHFAQFLLYFKPSHLAVDKRFSINRFNVGLGNDSFKS